MSVTPLERTHGPATTLVDQTIPRREVSPAPAYPTYEPVAAPKVGVKVRVVTRTSLLGAVLLRVALFSAVFGGTYVYRAVAGQVAVEKARHQELDARKRAVEAREAESEIRSRVDALTSAASVHQWATARSYIAPGEQAAVKTPGAPGSA